MNNLVQMFSDRFVSFISPFSFSFLPLASYFLSNFFLPFLSISLSLIHCLYLALHLSSPPSSLSLSLSLSIALPDLSEVASGSDLFTFLSGKGEWNSAMLII